MSNYEDGYYHNDSHLQLILPVSQTSINPDHQHLVIGNAGTDGVEFCFRFHESGIWAFYPMDDRSEKVADNIDQLIENWDSGTIKV